MTAKKTPAQKAAVAVNDGLQNVVTGMGGAGDKSSFMRWSLGGEGIGRAAVTPGEIEAAYKTNWLVRQAHDIPVDEMTKKWRTWDAKPEVIDAIEAEEKRLDIRAKIKEALLTGLMGGGALILGLPGDANTPAPKTITKGALRYVQVVSKHQLGITEFVQDLNDERFGEPRAFQYAGAEVHPTRVIVFPGRPLPLGLTTSESDRFWGAPLLESINEAMQNATLAVNGVAALIHDAKNDTISIPGLTDLVSTTQGEQRLTKRLLVASTMRSAYNVTLLDGGKSGVEGSGEKWETRQISFAQTPELVMTFVQLACGAADIPATRLVGTQAKGLNNGGEIDLANFRSMIGSRQDTDLRPRLEALDPYLLQSAGAPAGLKFTFAKLHELSAKEQAEVDNLNADTVKLVKDTGLVQFAPLAEAFVKRLDEGGTLPGLADLVAKDGGELPAEVSAQNEQAAALQAPGANDNAPRNVRVAQAAGGGRKPVRVRQVARDSLMRDADPRSLYVSRKVLNYRSLLAWARDNGIPNVEPGTSFHVTIVYSRTPVDWMKLPTDWSSSRDGRLVIPAGGPRLFERIGSGGAVALLFTSTDLKWRHESLIEAGAKSDYPDYQAHVTISWDVPEDFDLKKVTPYSGAISLGPEIFEEIIEG